MTILIVHMGTGTIIDASDDVVVVDTADLTEEEDAALEEEDMDIAEEHGVDIMKIIRHYTGERKSSLAKPFRKK